MDYLKIGQFIAERRKKLNLTQKQLGEKLNVTDKAVSKWERGLGCPDVSILGELSEILEVGIGEILNGEYDDNLKDNSEFVKTALDYSKKITEDNIYSKIRKILYFVLIVIVICISYMGVKQFIYLNNGVYFSVSENDLVYKEYEELKENYKIIKENEYLDFKDLATIKDGDYSNIVEDVIEDIEYLNLLSLDDRRYITDMGNMKHVFNTINFANYFLSYSLSKLDPKNSKYYEILSIYENTDSYDNISILVGMDAIYYENMYDYDNMHNLDMNYYYHLLRVRLTRLNKALELIIEMGDLNA